MAESYSVKAILSAVDRGFSSTLKSCSSALDRIDSKISGFSFGILTGAGQAAFNAITNGVTGLVSEIDSSNAAWKNFSSNMEILGKGEKEISGVKKELQEFAQQTVYSSSDMASTYAQLAAVGTKNTTQLVKGFGGLAAAAENPQQAMKTLSQQATQMAAKPSVAWADFKLMLEQTPAGIAAVAKHMGMSTSEMVTAVQSGEIATEDFFNAIAAVGGDANGEFQKMATEAKTVGQAMDGLKETVGNKLTPAFDLLSKEGIKAVNMLADKLAGINAEQLAGKVMIAMAKVKRSLTKAVEIGKKYYTAFKEAFDGVGSKVKTACDAIRTSLGGALSDTATIDGFKGAMQTVADIIKKIADLATKHADSIAKLIVNLPKIAIALKGFKIAKTVAPFVSTFTSGIASLASKGIGGIAGKLFGISKSQDAVGQSSAKSNANMFAAAKSYAMMGVAVVLVAAGFALLAFSAIQLANAGGLAIGVMAGLVVGVAAIGVGMALLLKTLAPMSGQLMPVATSFLAMGAAVLLVAAGFAVLTFAAISLANSGGLAIGVMVGMVAAIALLAVGAAALAPALTAGSVGLIAFGAAIVLVGAGAVLAAASLAIISAILPTIVAYGLQGAGAILALGGAMAVFAAGAALAGAASVVLGAGLTVAAVGIAAAGVAAVVAAVGLTALAGGGTLLAGAMVLVGGALMIVAGILPMAASGAVAGAVAFAGLMAVSAALTAVMLALNVPLVLIGASALVAAAGILVFGAGMLTGAAGTVAMAAALKAVSSQMKTISSNAKSAQKSLTSMRKSVKVVESGLDALGSKAKSALDKLKNAFDNTASKAQSAGTKTGTGFAQGMQPGLQKATSNAKTMGTQLMLVFTMTATAAKTAGMTTGMGYAQGMQLGLAKASAVAAMMTVTVAATLRSGRPGAYQAGAYISSGFAAGMRSKLAEIKRIASEMVKAAEKAIRAKAMIASPSKLTKKLGAFYGEGFAIGIADMARATQRAAQELVSIPQVATPNFATAYGYEMSGDYEYYRNAQYVVEVPLTVDGREFARATATYTQDELNRQQTRDSRKKGRV